MKHPDGSIISQYFGIQDKPTSGEDIYNQGLRLVVGQVEKIHYVDDQSNISKKYVEYDVSIRDAKGGQSTLRNVRKIDLLGGSNDHDEMVLEPNQFASKGKLETSNFFMNKNGTTVLLACIDGSKDKPIIIAAIQHPTKLGAKRIDGIRRKGEFRGIQWELNKDGELIITHQGPRSPDGKLLTSDKVLTVARFDKAGNLTVTDHANNQIRLNNTEIKVEIQSDVKGTKLVLDGKNDTVVTTTAGGLKTEMEGQTDKMTVTTKGGLVVVIDGQNDKTMITTAAGTKMIIDGTNDELIIETAAGARLRLKTDKVALGSGAVEILDKLSMVADLISTWVSTKEAIHTHLGNLGYPTAPTDQAIASTQLGTDLAQVRDDVDSIKGTL